MLFGKLSVGIVNELSRVALRPGAVTIAMGPWQPNEHTAGIWAAILEGGLSFVQFFWDKNRVCAQDRLAETIIEDVRKKHADREKAPDLERKITPINVQLSLDP